MKRQMDSLRESVPTHLPTLAPPSKRARLSEPCLTSGARTSDLTAVNVPKSQPSERQRKLARLRTALLRKEERVALISRLNNKRTAEERAGSAPGDTLSPSPNIQPMAPRRRRVIFSPDSKKHDGLCSKSQLLDNIVWFYFSGERKVKKPRHILTLVKEARAAERESARAQQEVAAAEATELALRQRSELDVCNVVLDSVSEEEEGEYEDEDRREEEEEEKEKGKEEEETEKMVDKNNCGNNTNDENDCVPMDETDAEVDRINRGAVSGGDWLSTCPLPQTTHPRTPERRGKSGEKDKPYLGLAFAFMQLQKIVNQLMKNPGESCPVLPRGGGRLVVFRKEHIPRLVKLLKLVKETLRLFFSRPGSRTPSPPPSPVCVVSWGIQNGFYRPPSQAGGISCVA